MPRWNPEQYLRFSEERTRPSRDLAAGFLAAGHNPDAGCGRQQHRCASGVLAGGTAAGCGRFGGYAGGRSEGNAQDSVCPGGSEREAERPGSV